MADISVTAGNVIKSTNAQTSLGVAGTAMTITAGQVLYKGADGKLYLANNVTSALTAAAVGIALNGASPGQPVRYQYAGDISFGAILTVGEIYMPSDTDGGIQPVGDYDAGDYGMILGMAKTTSIMTILLATPSTQVAHG